MHESRANCTLSASRLTNVQFARSRRASCTRHQASAKNVQFARSGKADESGANPPQPLLPWHSTIKSAKKPLNLPNTRYILPCWHSGAESAKEDRFFTGGFR